LTIAGDGQLVFMAKENKEKKNKSFVLRVDHVIMEAIEKWAADEFRSVNGQILYVLTQALKKSGRLPEKKAGEEGTDEPDRD
jgi:hypothetical protein